MIGETLGSYRIISQLGAGAMGEVYLAEHRHLKRKAALKLLGRDLVGRPDLLERFFLEARATSAIAHPGIVQIFDCEVDATGRPYIVMEYLAGETLAARLARSRPLPPPVVARIVRGIALALDAAHAKGIVHRDLKPENIFVETDMPDAVKLVDFGIAKLAGDFRAAQVHQTRTGSLMGTPLYMSPEQCRDSASTDFRTDLYSLGCVMFEMLIGQPPFAREALGDLIVAHLTEQPRDVRALNPSVPGALGELCAALLQKDPAARPASMRAVADRIDLFISSATTVPGSAGPVAPVASPVISGVPAAPSKTTLRDSAAEVLSVSRSMSPAPEPTPAKRVKAIALAAVVAVVGAGGLVVSRLRSSPPVAPVTASPARPPAGNPGGADPAPPPQRAANIGEATGPGRGESAGGVASGAAQVDDGTHGKKSASRHATAAARISRGERIAPTGSPGALVAESNGTSGQGPAPAPPAMSPPPVAKEGAHPQGLPGAWEGPWNDAGKQQKGRLYLFIAGDESVSGWMFNTSARQSFRLLGRMGAGGGVDLVCQCPPGQGFNARGALHVGTDGEVKGQLSLSGAAGVFGQSSLTLRRTTPR